jgi:hypothetical protein
VDADTDLILGAALLGHNAGEVISSLQMAMLGALPYQQVRDAVLTHPTMGEGLNLLLMRSTISAEASWPEISSPDTKRATVGSAAPATPQSIRISLRSPDQRVWKVPSASVR